LDWGVVKVGIPQGSALEPPLFQIYVNDMPVQVQHSVLQFSDDTCLICCGDSNKDTSRQLTEDLTSLSQWIAASQMQINVHKSSIVWFYTKQSRWRVQPSLVYLEGSPLQHVNYHKYLGMCFDSQLKWDVHVANTCKRCVTICI